MPKNPFSKTGRSSVITSSSTDNPQAPRSGNHNHQTPLQTLRKAGDKLRPHTNVTSATDAPGHHDYDQPAGTGVPIAGRANPNALNAGQNHGDANTSYSSQHSQQPQYNQPQQQQNDKANEPSLEQRANNQDQSKRTQRVMKDDKDAPAPAANGAANEFDFNENSDAHKVRKNAEEYLPSEDDPMRHRNDASQSESQPESQSKSGTTFSKSSQQAERLREVQYRVEHGAALGDTFGAMPVVDRSNLGTNPETNASIDNRNHTSEHLQHSDHTSDANSSYSNRTESRSVSTNHVPIYVDRAERSMGRPETIPGTPMASATETAREVSQAYGVSQARAGVAGGVGAGLSNRQARHGMIVDGDADRSTASVSASVSGSSVSRSQQQPQPQSMEATTASEIPHHTLATNPANASINASHQGDKEQEDLNTQLPKDTVPGLHAGDDDPDNKNNPKKAKETFRNPGGASADMIGASKNLDKSTIDKKYGTKEAQLERQRSLEADYVGWRQIGGWDPRTSISQEESDSLLQRSTLLEDYVNEKYFGDWYQNTGIILGTAVMAWLIGKFGFSVSWLSFVLLIAGTSYRTSIRRLRRNYRDDVLREMALGKIENDNETMEWLNSFVVKFWLIYEPSLSKMITEIVNEVLKEQTPGFIDSISLQKFTLGTKSPRIEHVRSFPKTDPTVAVMDFSMSFTPNDVMDLTSRQLQTKVNPKLQLGIRVGKGPIAQNFPILVEDMSFKGTMRFRFKLMSKFPHVQTLDASFIEPPDFDFVLKPIGGDKLGFDVVKLIPGLSKFIKETIHANLGPMFYAPNAFQVNVEQMMAGVGVMSGVGVLSVSIRRCSKLPTSREDGKVDPYVRLLSNDKAERARTKIKANNSSPVFEETLHMIVTNLSETCMLEVLDFNEKHNDRVIGTVPLNIEKLANSTGDEFIQGTLTSGGRKVGTIEYAAHFSPVHMPPTAEESADGGEVARDSKSGILSLSVTGARNLNSTLSKVGKVSPFCEIQLGGKLLDSTKSVKNSNDPDFSYAQEHIVLNKSSAQMIFRVKDKLKGRSPQIGHAKFRLAQLLLENQKGNNWFPLSPEGSGEIQIQTQWKPATIADSSGANYVEPVGVLRMNIKNARDLRNLEHIGKVDPYVRVFLNNAIVGRTDWFQNTMNPQWDEVLYIPVQNELQELCLEVMDVEKRAKDRSLGSFKVDLTSIMQKDEQGQYKVFVSPNEQTSRLVMPNRGPKGTVTYTLEFFPAVSIVAPSERKRLAAEKEKVKELEAIAKPTDAQKEDLENRLERLETVGVDMPLEEQLKFPAGVFAFTIDHVDGTYGGQRLRVTADNKPFPIYVSPKARGKRLVIGESGDYTTGQMPLSSLRLQLVNDQNVDDPAQVMGEIVLGCRELLENAYDEPKTYELGKAKFGISVRYFPIPELVIDQREDISKTGCIEVFIDRAEGVAAADRGGTSDPYCAFFLNNDKERIYKTEIIKKTLDPVWKEQFRFDIDNINSSTMKAMVYDWDMGNKDDFLGGAEFSFGELEPLVWRDFQVPLFQLKKDKDVKNPKECDGTLSIRLRFSPGVLHTEKDDGIIGLKTVTAVGGAGINAVGKVGGAGIGAVGKVGGAGVGAVGKVGGAGLHAGSKVLGVFGRKSMDSRAAEEEENLNDYTVSIISINGLEDASNIQARFFKMDGREKEVFKSKAFKVDSGSAEIEEGVFEIRAFPDETLGIKLREAKSMGRHSDVGQATVPLSQGEHSVDFGGIVAEISVSVVG